MIRASCVLLFLALPFSGFSQIRQAHKSVAVADEKEDSVSLNRNDKQPEFKGGYEAMMRFINKQQKYPRAAKKARVEGTVYISFVVDKDGSVTDVKTIRGIHPDCDAEAERVVKLFPNWHPAILNGRPVPVRFSLPIKFKL
jgi:periplasmic protein TonB